MKTKKNRHYLNSSVGFFLSKKQQPFQAPKVPLLVNIY